MSINKKADQPYLPKDFEEDPEDLDQGLIFNVGYCTVDEQGRIGLRFSGQARIDLGSGSEYSLLEEISEDDATPDQLEALCCLEAGEDLPGAFDTSYPLDINEARVQIVARTEVDLGQLPKAIRDQILNIYYGQYDRDNPYQTRTNSPER